MTIVEEILSRASVADTGRELSAKLAEDAVKISEVCDVILKKAVATRASDVHIEPIAQGIRVRYRIDGVFQDLATLPLRFQEPLTARVKVLADLVSHRKELSQEGRLVVEAGAGVRGDFRVSIVPTVAGERVVLRMFNPDKGSFDLASLGYRPSMTATLERMLFNMAGIVVLTGPSGCGKTTTMYASLHHLYHTKDQFASICTIEDPVEYEFGLFSQIQVNRKVGLDFAGVLSAVLRQDPEVIMIGEIRDAETCQIALRAGLTGHLVLTTIHSGSACEVVTRLLNMDVEPFVVASALTGVVAQRLVRKICANCKKSANVGPAHVALVERELGVTGLKLKMGEGCASCGRTGFHGRLPVAELLELDDEVRGAILAEPATSALEKIAVARGMRPLFLDGLDKVKDGLTSLDEVIRVIGTKETATT